MTRLMLWLVAGCAAAQPAPAPPPEAPPPPPPAKEAAPPPPVEAPERHDEFAEVLASEIGRTFGEAERTCLPETPTFSGDLEVVLAIDPEGLTKESRSEDSTLPPEIETCFVEAFRGLRLPPRKGGDTVYVRLPKLRWENGRNVPVQ